jgi:aryl-alcohol dehydrogenase-like predicted oxidoreductase
MEYRKLGNTDLQVSILGFGASPLGNEFGGIDVAEGERAVHFAIDQGINFFDVAPYYGRTLAEQRLGNALNGKRDKVVLATKCCRYDVDGFDFSAARVLSDVEASLQRLKTDSVDLLQIHDIEFGDRRQIIEETIPAAREAQRAGKARYIGITGLPLKILRDVAAEVPVDTILSYARYNLLVTDLDDILRPLCEQNSIGLINASPLHMRVLTEEGAPAWHPAQDEVKETGPKVAAVCCENGLQVSDVALRFCLSYPHAASTLVGMSKQRHVEQNLKAMETNIPPTLLKKIRSLTEPVKNRIWATGREENRD